MARTTMIYNKPTLKVATTEAGLSTGLAVECQVTSARVQAQPNYNTIPATGCGGAVQSPGLTGFQLVLAWLQDWTAPGGGLSGFAWDNDGAEVWWELVPNADDATTTKMSGSSYCAAGDYGGTFGDGSAADATATWPCREKPDVTMPAPVAAAADEQPPVAA